MRTWAAEAKLALLLSAPVAGTGWRSRAYFGDLQPLAGEWLGDALQQLVRWQRGSAPLLKVLVRQPVLGKIASSQGATSRDY